MEPPTGVRLCASAMMIVACSCGIASNESDANRHPDTSSVVIGAAHGQTDTLDLYRFSAPDHYSVQFSTYVPLDMTAQAAPLAGEESVSFDLRRRGPASVEDPLVHVYFYPAGTTEHRARVQVEAFAASRGVPVSEQESAAAPLSEEGIPPEAGSVVGGSFQWALLESPYAYRCAATASACAVGRIALGRVGERFFHVLIQYPPNMATSFLPRAQQILRHWRWHR